MFLSPPLRSLARTAMPAIKRESLSPPLVTVKRRRLSSASSDSVRRCDNEYGPAWSDWPAPRIAMEAARGFVRDIVAKKRSVLLVPDKDADGLSAGTLMYRTLQHMGLPANRIQVQHLLKGNNVFGEEETRRMEESKADRIIILDQGSRPGPALVASSQQDASPRVLIVDHHMSTQWPQDSQVLTACHTPPIATAALLTYALLRDLHPAVADLESWRALVGVFGDLGSQAVKWGTPPWPSELGVALKKYKAKAVSDAVAAVNAPRRTADYNVPRAWEIMLNANGPGDVASNAFLKLCRLDVNEETERWARTAPKFAVDGRVAVIHVHTGYQIHPVIATRWAGNLGRKSKKLIMVVCANTGFNPDPNKVSFSCRIAASLRSLPDEQRPDLIALLEEYGNAIPGFRERVGGDFARGHKEATGGIIPKAEWSLLLEQMGVPLPGAAKEASTSPKTPKRKVIDASQTNGIKDFFKVVDHSPASKQAPEPPKA